MLHLVLKELGQSGSTPRSGKNHDMGYSSTNKFNEQSNVRRPTTPLRKLFEFDGPSLPNLMQIALKAKAKSSKCTTRPVAIGGMLTIGKEYIQSKEINPDAEVYPYGQELNPRHMLLPNPISHKGRRCQPYQRFYMRKIAR